MQCPYLDQSLGKCIIGGFLGGSNSGGYYCKCTNRKLTNSYVNQACRKNDIHNQMRCNYHPNR